jgi:organic radical activating enzyme
MSDTLEHDRGEERSDERERVGIDIAARLSDRGVSLTGGESSEELVSLLEALERFERAVQAKGGDLMVDEGPSDAKLQPDDAAFVLPRRADDESVGRYIRRIEEATNAIGERPAA